MNRLRNRLVVVFLAATLVPLGATLWITTSLLERSLRYSSTGQVDALSKALEKTGRELYQWRREALKSDALAGRLAPARYAATGLRDWPREVQEFWESGASERFSLAGEEGERINYLVRRPEGVWVYSSGLGAVSLARLSDQYRQARQLVEHARATSGADSSTPLSCWPPRSGWYRWRPWCCWRTASAAQSSN